MCWTIACSRGCSGARSAAAPRRWREWIEGAGAVTGELEIRDADRWITGAQLGVVWRNPGATLEWGFGFNTRGDRRFDLSLGRQF